MILMIDPPWDKRKGGKRKTRPNQGALLDYPTMTTPSIFALLDRELDLPNQSTVFMWCIDSFLHGAEQEMKQRGFKLHARMIWDKENGVAPAFTVRYSHEYLLWFYQSPMTSIAIGARGKFPTVIREKSRQHSRKPDSAYRMIDCLYPLEEKVDVFSREPRNGWMQWGNDLDHFGAGN